MHKSPKRAYTLEGEENKTQFFFWQGLRIVGETTEAHLENRRWYAYNEGSYEPIAFIDYWDIVKRDEVYYYHTNINGAPEELTSGSGEFTWQGLFSLFGKRYREQNDGHTLYGQPLRFQGQYFDEETGLHYITFRYYDPETGRFTQQDPIGLAGGINLYQYAPNPLMWVDPLGWWTYNTMPKLLGFQIHHIIPQALKNHEVIKLAGLKIHDINNTIYLPKTEQDHPTRTVHNGSHKNYNDSIEKALDEILHTGKGNKWNSSQYKNALDDLIKEERKNLRKGTTILNKNSIRTGDVHNDLFAREI